MKAGLIGAAALALLVAACGPAAQQAEAEMGMQGPQMAAVDAGMPPMGPDSGPPAQFSQVAQVAPQGGGGGSAMAGGAEQALQQVAMMRQAWCQQGNQLACQSLSAMPGHQQKLAQSAAGCRQGNQRACGEYNNLAQRIFQEVSNMTGINQSHQQNMGTIAAGTAAMTAGHNQRMGEIQRRGAANTAAHNARQESYGAMNQTYNNTQAMGERNTGRFNDYIYEGTTMQGGGVQTRAPYGSTAYTDGSGNVVYGAQGGQAPSGWQELTPSYEAPQ